MKCTQCGAGSKKKHKEGCSKRPTVSAPVGIPLTKQLVQPGRPQATPKPSLVNYIGLVVDQSGSMEHLTEPLLKNLRSQIQVINDKVQETGQETYVTLAFFGASRIDIRHSKAIPAHVFNLDYFADGNTPLFDAVGVVANDLTNHPSQNADDVSYLIITLTDGEENASRRWTADTFQALLRDRLKTDKWTFAFLVPHGGRRVLEGFGVPSGCIQEWEQTARGVDRAFASASIGTSSYYAARSVGRTSVQDFFTDATKVDPSKLQDLTSRFRSIAVDHEVDISTLVKSVLGWYQPGSAFYELTKPETIQGFKDVMVMDKFKGTLYGGQEARQMVGIPVGGTVKVKPGNHGNYRIFVRSTSLNRKLVRGTTVLVEKR